MEFAVALCRATAGRPSTPSSLLIYGAVSRPSAVTSAASVVASCFHFPLLFHLCLPLMLPVAISRASVVTAFVAASCASAIAVSATVSRRPAVVASRRYFPVHLLLPFGVAVPGASATVDRLGGP